MNRRAMSPVRALAAAALLPTALLVAGCDQAVAINEAPLTGSSIGGPFELTDSHGKTVRWSDFSGKYRMVYFGYTYCPDVCPLDVRRMMLGYDRFKQADPGLAAQIQPIFISIDPGRDTPAKVGEFARAFSADLLGLTGTQAQVDQAAAAFKVLHQKGQDAGGDSYLMDHSRVVYLMGRQGEPIAPLPADVADQGEAVAAELAKWVR